MAGLTARFWPLRVGWRVVRGASRGVSRGVEGGCVSPQWHLWVDSLPPKGAIGWNPSEGDATVMRPMPASGGLLARTGAAPRPAAKVARQTAEPRVRRSSVGYIRN